MVAGDLASPGGGGRTAVSRAARSVGELGGGLRSRGGGRIGAPQRGARRDASPRAPRRDPRSLSVRGDLKIAGSEDPAYISGLLKIAGSEDAGSEDAGSENPAYISGLLKIAGHEDAGSED